MDVKYHSLRQAVQEERVHLKYMDTKEHLADVFTKQEGETVPTATPPTAAPTTTPPDDLKERAAAIKCQKCCRLGLTNVGRTRQSSVRYAIREGEHVLVTEGRSVKKGSTGPKSRRRTPRKMR